MTGRLGTLLAVVRLGRLRYLALTLPAFVAGAVGSPQRDSRYLLLGAVAIVVLRMVSSLANCVSDRTEDAIDHPDRAALCATVGHAALLRLTATLALTYLAFVGAMAVWLHVVAPAILLWLAYLAAKLAYSFGPRLKPRRGSATMLLGAVSGAMFFVGWIGTGLEQTPVAVAGAVLLWTMGASLCGSKDVPDLDGDARIGYRSIYRDVMDSAKPLRRVLAVTSRPYLVVLAIAVVPLGAGAPAARVLWCLAAYPCAVAFALVLVRARTATERSLVRECGYLYWLVFMDLVLLSFVPQPATAAAAAAGLAWYLAMSRLAHPDPAPIELRHVRTTLGILTRAPMADVSR